MNERRICDIHGGLSTRGDAADAGPWSNISLGRRCGDRVFLRHSSGTHTAGLPLQCLRPRVCRWFQMRSLDSLMIAYCPQGDLVANGQVFVVVEGAGVWLPCTVDVFEQSEFTSFSYPMSYSITPCCWNVECPDVIKGPIRDSIVTSCRDLQDTSL